MPGNWLLLSHYSRKLYQLPTFATFSVQNVLKHAPSISRGKVFAFWKLLHFDNQPKPVEIILATNFVMKLRIYGSIAFSNKQHYSRPIRDLPVLFFFEQNALNISRRKVRVSKLILLKRIPNNFSDEFYREITPSGRKFFRSVCSVVISNE